MTAIGMSLRSTMILASLWKTRLRISLQRRRPSEAVTFSIAGPGFAIAPASRSAVYIVAQSCTALTAPIIGSVRLGADSRRAARDRFRPRRLRGLGRDLVVKAAALQEGAHLCDKGLV